MGPLLRYLLTLSLAGFGVSDAINPPPRLDLAPIVADFINRIDPARDYGGLADFLNDFVDEYENTLPTDGAGFGVDPETKMDARELITSKGYPCELHYVQTDDGYIIQMQRIPHGLAQTKAKYKTPVILQHGLLCSSTNWITNLRNESLGFILADAGFDVWLGNIRGNTYGKNHTTLKPSDYEFWNFTLDQHALSDLPAMVDYVLNETNTEQLNYVGHSQGTMIMFAKGSYDPKFQKKIKQFHALAPVARVGHILTPIKYLAYITPELEELFKIFGLGEFLPNDFILNFLARTACNSEFRWICSDVLFVIAGPDVSNLNKTRLPVYITHTPAGTSTKNIVHFAQLYRNKKFEMFDYGLVKNWIKYKQMTPPQYNLTKFTMPTHIYYSTSDWLADEKDVMSLLSDLQNVLTIHNYVGWNHLDFIWGEDAGHGLYQTIADRLIAGETV